MCEVEWDFQLKNTRKQNCIPMCRRTCVEFSNVVSLSKIKLSNQQTDVVWTSPVHSIANFSFTQSKWENPWLQVWTGLPWRCFSPKRLFTNIYVMSNFSSHTSSTYLRGNFGLGMLVFWLNTEVNLVYTFNFYIFEYIRASNKTLQIFKLFLSVWDLENKACGCLTLPIACSISLA